MTKKIKGVLNKGKLGDGEREDENKQNVITKKEPGCYSNTKLGKTTVTAVHSSALNWLQVTMV